MSIEAMKQALEALESERDKYLEWGDKDGAPEDVYEAITTLRTAIEQAEKQEPVVHQDWCASLTRLLLSMPPQPAPCDCQPIKRKAEKQERYFCERCGKRLSGGIHTCTPPAEAEKQIEEQLKMADENQRIRAELKFNTIAEAEKQEPVAYLYHDARTPMDAHPWLHSTMLVLAADRRQGLQGETPLYTHPQPKQPLMLEKFREMKALLDDDIHTHKKMFTDDELKIIMETTMPEIDWKARHGVELNNGERNKWMLEWFIAFARAIETAHGIKE